MSFMGFDTSDKGLPWPKGEDGVEEAPVFLEHIFGGPLDLELALNLLTAYGIPTVCQYPSNGLFGKLVLGFPTGGIEVYVPESRLEEAKDIRNADTFEEEEV